jgi:hypothetical protein
MFSFTSRLTEQPESRVAMKEVRLSELDLKAVSGSRALVLAAMGGAEPKEKGVWKLVWKRGGWLGGGGLVGGLGADGGSLTLPDTPSPNLMADRR